MKYHLYFLFEIQDFQTVKQFLAQDLNYVLVQDSKVILAISLSFRYFLIRNLILIWDLIFFGTGHQSATIKKPFQRE